jgi:hypothetical protein
MFTDVGVGGSEWYSDGVRWRAVGGQVILKNNGVGGNSTSSQTLSKLLTYQMPLGILGAGDVIEMQATALKPLQNGTTTLSLFLGNQDTTQTGTIGTGCHLGVTSSGATIGYFSVNADIRFISDTGVDIGCAFTANKGGAAPLSGNTMFTVANGALLQPATTVYVGLWGLVSSALDTLSVSNLRITLKTCG